MKKVMSFLLLMSLAMFTVANVGCKKGEEETPSTDTDDGAGTNDDAGANDDAGTNDDAS